MGGLQFFSALAHKVYFPPETLRYSTLTMPSWSSAYTQCLISWTRVLRCVYIVPKTLVLTNFRTIQRYSLFLGYSRGAFLVEISQFYKNFRSKLFISTYCGSIFVKAGKFTGWAVFRQWAGWIYWVGTVKLLITSLRHSNQQLSFWHQNTRKQNLGKVAIHVIECGILDLAEFVNI